MLMSSTTIHAQWIFFFITRRMRIAAEIQAMRRKENRRDIAALVHIKHPLMLSFLSQVAKEL
jgi:hypothetical protein